MAEDAAFPSTYLHTCILRNKVLILYSYRCITGSVSWVVLDLVKHLRMSHSDGHKFLALIIQH